MVSGDPEGLDKGQHFTRLVCGKLSLHGVSAKAGQRRFVQIGQFQAPPLQEDVLHHTREADLIGVEDLAGDIVGELAGHNVPVGGEVLQVQQVAQELQQAIHFEALIPVRGADVGLVGVQVAAARPAHDEPRRRCGQCGEAPSNPP
jgi:hypothetical protein